MFARCLLILVGLGTTFLLTTALASAQEAGQAEMPAVETLLVEYAQGQPALKFNARAGEENWYRQRGERSCTSCHGDSLQVAGRHAKTGKIIEPMAPSVNQARLTDVKKIKKWLLRNCKWTFGRECSAQEKGDFLLWLSNQ